MRKFREIVVGIDLRCVAKRHEPEGPYEFAAECFPVHSRIRRSVRREVPHRSTEFSAHRKAIELRNLAVEALVEDEEFLPYGGRRRRLPVRETEKFCLLPPSPHTSELRENGFKFWLKNFLQCTHDENAVRKIVHIFTCKTEVNEREGFAQIRHRL